MNLLQFFFLFLVVHSNISFGIFLVFFGSQFISVFSFLSMWMIFLEMDQLKPTTTTTATQFILDHVVCWKINLEFTRIYSFWNWITALDPKNQIHIQLPPLSWHRQTSTFHFKFFFIIHHILCLFVWSFSVVVASCVRWLYRISFSLINFAMCFLLSQSFEWTKNLIKFNQKKQHQSKGYFHFFLTLNHTFLIVLSFSHFLLFLIKNRSINIVTFIWSIFLFLVPD